MYVVNMRYNRTLFIPDETFGCHSRNDRPVVALKRDNYK